MNYPVNEIFETIQGEASFTGTPAVFIRLQGCPVGCAWCDTKHTWRIPEAGHPGAPKKSAIFDEGKMEHLFAWFGPQELAGALERFKARHVVITGGEPCLYDLVPLTQAIIESGRRVQLETSGAFPVRIDGRAWVTVSPKIGMPGSAGPLPESLLIADEIKFPVGKQSDIDYVAEHYGHLWESGVLIWLQPLSQSKKATELCVQAAIEHGWKVSIQTHKFIGVR